ncbi:MAG: lactate dehydrogenase, partial [Planctomycetes bacterium]|nr:lactate dehydrogenase [Planctomycetota bacterium]
LATRRGEWPRTPLTPIRTKTLGIFGLGRIGRSMAVRALALGMNVIATEKFPDQDFLANHHVELVDFDELLSRSDFITIHSPLTDDTHGVFNKDAFSKMKQGAALINSARGDIVVETDLLDALKSGHLSGAGLDVFQQEPPSPDNPLFELDCVVTSPHIAGADDISLEAMGVEAAECIVNLHRGEWPDGAVVNGGLKAEWQW